MNNNSNYNVILFLVIDIYKLLKFNLKNKSKRG